MPTKEQRQALLKTLEQANLEYIKPEKIRWLAFADAVVEQNEKVHRATNDLLLKLLLDGDTGRCIHVTGEMRALLDPFHRGLCAKMFKQSGNVFSVLFNLPRNKRQDRNSAIGWSLKKWSEKGTGNWQEYLRTFDMLAEHTVDVRASNSANEIQYSVFGNRYIQLQEKHPDAAKAKRVWLLECQELNEVLTERGERLLNQSTDIDERWYSSFMSTLGGLGARLVLRKLTDERALAVEELDEAKLHDFGGSMIETVDALKTVGLIRTDKEDRWMISPRGKQYLNLLMRT